MSRKFRLSLVKFGTKQNRELPSIVLIILAVPSLNLQKISQKKLTKSYQNLWAHPTFQNAANAKKVSAHNGVPSLLTILDVLICDLLISVNLVTIYSWTTSTIKSLALRRSSCAQSSDISDFSQGPVVVPTTLKYWIQFTSPEKDNKKQCFSVDNINQT